MPKRIIDWLYRFYIRQLTRRELTWLDDRLLADLGIERSHIDELARSGGQKPASAEMAAAQRAPDDPTYTRLLR